MLYFSHQQVCFFVLFFILNIYILFFIMCFFTKKLFTIISFLALGSVIISGLSGLSLVQKIANATLVNACGAQEVLENNSCVFNKVANVQYETKCAVGYTLMDATCSKFTTQTCSFFTQGLIAENGMCKLDLTSPVYGTEILDYDGRQCDGPGTNYKRYNVGLSSNSLSGPIICGNNFSLLDKTTFRFLPRVIGEISNLTSVQTSNIYPNCPTGYTEIPNNKCSRPSTAQSCNAGGETFVNNTCIACSAGQYCPVDGAKAKLVTVCANGGSLINNICYAPVKYSVTIYTDGCTSEYIKKDQSCAVVENRVRDTGCSYFYISENINITATQGSDGYCSTGGRTDFASTSIFRVSDFNCNGVGTYYYNYNVAYDPLVCGNDYNLVGKNGFKWLPETFTKITALQKIPNITFICPIGWNSFDNSDKCSQSPITQEFKDPIDCPVDTYCPVSSITPITCPAGTTSPIKSTKLSDCVYKLCSNGTVNPPLCNQCPAGLQFINSSCLPVCPIGVIRDSSNNCSVCTNGAVNPSSGCNACTSGFQFNGSTCVAIVGIICKNGFDLSGNSCICNSPKIIVNKPVNNTGLFETFCQNPVSSSSFSSSSSLILSSSSNTSSSVIKSSSISSLSSSFASSVSSVSSLPVSISGYVYIDSNNNGIFENNESPIPSVTIKLSGTQDPCKNTSLSVTTNNSGFYEFNNFDPCTYSIIQSQPAGYNNGITTTGSVNGVKVGTVTVSDRIDNITLISGQKSINNNFGEIVINTPVTTNAGGTIVINNNNPVANNNNSVSNNNVVNNYSSPGINTSPIVQSVPKAQFIPMTTEPKFVTYYASPVATITETIRSGGFNIILITSMAISVATFGLIYVRGRRNQGFGNYTLKNSVK
jgi:SdrD B-like domain